MSTRTRSAPRAVSLAGFCALMAIFAFSPAVSALITSGGCVDDVSGTSNVCTANDVTFVAIGLGTQQDGCVNAGDTLDILLGGTVANTTAQSRYDIGLYVAVDGDPNGDGAQSGICAREILTPVGVQGVLTCNPATPNALDLLRLRDDYAPLDGLPDNGYYLNVDGDTCGDLNASATSNQTTGCDEDLDGVWDDTIIRFTAALSFPCDDVDANGYIEIPTCATWGNQNNQVGGATCDSEIEAVPGTKSKCNCQTINSTVPSPNLALTCSSPAMTLYTGDTGTFSVTYSNSVTCTPDLTLPEREQCGTGSYIFYVIDYDQTRGTVSNIQLTRGDGSLVGGGSVTHDTVNGTITWTPVSSALGTSGIIGGGDTVTLSYDYTYTSTEQNVTLSASSATYWTNSASEVGNTAAPGVTSQATLSCLSTVSATPVTLSSVQVGERSGRPELTWTTATESANLGFNVYAEGPDGWQRVNDEPIASRAIDSTAPERYAFDLSGVAGRRFMIEDVALDGTAVVHGPYDVGGGYGAQPAPEPVDWTAIRAEAVAAAAGRGSIARRKGSTGQGGQSGSPTVRLLVDTDGVQRVTYEELASAGFDFGGVPSSQLALTRGGVAVPIRVEPVGGTFGPGAYVEFLGEAVDSLYTRTSVYELTRDPVTATRIPEDRTKLRAGTPASTYRETLTVERDVRYSFASPGDDPWYDTRMLAFESPRSFDFDVDLAGYVADGAPVGLEVELWGVTTWPEEGDHHAVLLWNGNPVGEAIWDAQDARWISATVPAAAVTAGPNVLTVQLPGDRGVPWDVIDLDRFSVTYPRAFQARGGDLTFTAAGDLFEVGGAGVGEPAVYAVGPGGPVHIADVAAESDAGGNQTLRFRGLGGFEATYHVAVASTVEVPGIEAARQPAALLDGPADYLVISHQAFLDGLAPLVSAREAQGLAVKVADVADVYDLYSGGVVDPEAIRRYIAYAARSLGTRYVLLVGGDTFDYHDNLGLGSVSFVPSLYAPTGSIVRFAPVDPLYTDLDGDRVPDLPIGRLPVRTRAELDAVVAKILAYDAKGYGRTTLAVADAPDDATGFSFSQAAEQMISTLPAGWSVRRAYVDTLGAAGAREALFRELEGGVALTSFIGHSGLTHWTFSNLFAAGDVEALGNVGAPTVVVQWGCWNTYHVEPRFQTLGHRLLLAPDRGAAAVLGSATLLGTSSAAALSERLMPLLAERGMTLGDAVTAAKQELAAAEPERVDAILGWTLLGDPAQSVDP